jgi:hypothetical protein
MCTRNHEVSGLGIFHWIVSFNNSVLSSANNPTQQRQTKLECIKGASFIIMAYAKRVAKIAIKLYNKIRLHLSLAFKTPN